MKRLTAISMSIWILFGTVPAAAEHKHLKVEELAAARWTGTALAPVMWFGSERC